MNGTMCDVLNNTSALNNNVTPNNKNERRRKNLPFDKKQPHRSLIRYHEMPLQISDTTI